MHSTVTDLFSLIAHAYSTLHSAHTYKHTRWVFRPWEGNDCKLPTALCLILHSHRTRHMRESSLYYAKSWRQAVWLVCIVHILAHTYVQRSHTSCARMLNPPAGRGSGINVFCVFLLVTISTCAWARMPRLRTDNAPGPIEWAVSTEVLWPALLSGSPLKWSIN